MDIAFGNSEAAVKPLRNWHIMAATTEHIPYLAAVELAAANRFDHKDLPEPLRQQTVEGNLLRRCVEERSLWVAKEDHFVIGFALAERKGAFTHLHELAVHPEHGRRGIGRDLVMTVIDWARQEKLIGVTLNTFRHVPWNAPFYAKLGFTEVPHEEGPAYLHAHAETEAREGLNPANRCAMWLLF